MTRINCIPVERIPKKRRFSEYREMMRVRHATNHTNIPDSYRMGKGHVTFFYDKGEYLVNRHKQLRDSLIKDGYQINYELDLSSWPVSAMNDWEPDVDSKIISVARIINRMVEK